MTNCIMTHDEIIESYKRYFKARIDKGLTDKDVAARAGISRNGIVNWKKGRALPQAKSLLKIATILETTPSSFLTG